MIKIPFHLPKAIAWLVRHARLCTLSCRSARRRCGTAYRFAGMARGEPTDRGHRRQGKLLGEFRCRFQPRARRGGLCRNDPPGALRRRRSPPARTLCRDRGIACAGPTRPRAFDRRSIHPSAYPPLWHLVSAPTITPPPFLRVTLSFIPPLLTP